MINLSRVLLVQPARQDGVSSRRALGIWSNDRLRSTSRPCCLRNTDLFRDFTFKNANAALTLTLSGPGIAANSDYELKLWSYDSNSGGKTHSQSYAGVSGTVGAAGPIVYPAGGNPSSLDSFSAIGTFTSDGAGVLTIELTDTITSGSNNPEPRLNGLQLSPVPEPSAIALLGLGGLALIGRRRR